VDLKFFKNLGKDKVKWLTTIFAAAVGLFLLIGGNPFQDSTPPTINTPPQESNDLVVDKNNGQPNIATEEEYLANKLQQILHLVEGAGEVKVTVRLASSSTAEYAVNTSAGTKTTQEKDQAGGTRVQTEDNDTGQLVLIRNNGGQEVPVLQNQTAPNILGVLVVSEGAKDPAIKAELFRAVRVGLGVEPQKVLVLPKDKQQISE
jgi:stage III sporulation protein AG